MTGLRTDLIASCSVCVYTEQREIVNYKRILITQTYLYISPALDASSSSLLSCYT